MKREELEAVMNAFDMFDTGLLFHAYRSYMRDYELIVINDGITAPRGLYSYVFRYCVEASTRIRIGPEQLINSLDDRLTDYETYKTLWDDGVELGDFVWGVKWSECYPGWSLVDDSERASYWTNEMGIDFYETLIETNAIEIRLIFSDLIVTMLSDELPAPDEASTWLDRFDNAPAPSPSSQQFPVETSPPADAPPANEARNEDGVLLRSRRRSTMSFYILLDGKPIGMLEPVEADQGKGVVVGWFTPLPAFEQVRDLFRQITLADRISLTDVRDLTLDYFKRSRAALNLTVITAGGRPVPARELQIHGVTDDGALLDGYKAEFEVTMAGFFDDPRYWSG